MNSKFLAVSLIFLTVICLSKSQISFSTDWSGGKRSDATLGGFIRPFLMEKRKPGWGKRSESKYKFSG
jgi:hypothetical protein